MADNVTGNQDLTDMTNRLRSAQDVEHDNRERVREADLFLNKRDGQWEPSVINRMTGKPRYTFDHCNPVVDAVMGEMESMDFAIDVKPAGGDSTKDMAQNFGGIIRNIENISGARYIYKSAARQMIGTGLGGWRLTNEYRDSDCFYQDLMIRPVSNFKDRVWFDEGAEARTMADAEECWVLSPLTINQYNKEYPKGSGLSVGEDRQTDSWYYKKSAIVIGERLWKKKKKRNIHLLSNGSVVVEDDDFLAVRDEMFRMGITVQGTRVRETIEVYQQLFDGGDFLTEETKTVFQYIPIIPAYANFEISEEKVIYWGAVEKLMDAQRVLNYAESRKIEEGALKPRTKDWLTKDQATSPDVRNTLRTSNTNTDSFQLWDWKEGQPPPFRPPEPQPNPNLIQTAQSAEAFINRSLPDESRGQSTPGRSGVAIELLQNKGDNGNYKYFTAMEIAICHTCKILLKAIPIVYDTKQELRILGQDGSEDTITIKENILDEQTGRMVEINDLSKGKYDVTCSAGPAFHNRQQETVAAMNELITILPGIGEIGADILVNNISSPGMDLLGERIRLQKVMSGQIPESQLTDDEKEMIAQQQAAAAQQQEQPSAVDAALAAQAKAETDRAQANTADILSKIAERQDKSALKADELELKNRQMLLNFQSSQQKLQSDQQKQFIDLIKAQSDELKKQAETLKIIREAMGVDTVIGPENTEAYENQAEIVTETQEQQERAL